MFKQVLKTNSSSATAVGDVNLVLQNSTQANYQNQINHNDYSVPMTPSIQTTVQGNVSEATTADSYNIVGQEVTQTSTQGQTNINQYFLQH